MKKTADKALFYPSSKRHAKSGKLNNATSVICPVCCDTIATKTKSQILKTHN